MRSPASSDIDAVLGRINERDATRWSVIGRLPGGYLQGAYELRDSRGQRGVLKWHPSDLSVAQLTSAARSIEDMRARGWPTSRWLTSGVLPGVAPT